MDALGAAMRCSRPLGAREQGIPPGSALTAACTALGQLGTQWELFLAVVVLLNILTGVFSKAKWTWPVKEKA